MKRVVVSVAPANALVRPRKRAWIETKLLRAYYDVEQVRPRKRAWIETRILVVRHQRRLAFALARGRGLKPKIVDATTPLGAFALARGRGLKPALNGIVNNCGVRPRKRAWIETISTFSARGLCGSFALARGRGLKRD